MSRKKADFVDWRLPPTSFFLQLLAIAPKAPGIGDDGSTHRRGRGKDAFTRNAYLWERLGSSGRRERASQALKPTECPEQLAFDSTGV
jgi:hypothetical protein